MIETVIFDLGKVLVPFEIERGYAALAGVCPHPPDEIRRRLIATGLVPKLETGQVAPREFVAAVTKALDVEAGYEEFRRLWSCIFLPDTLIPESMVKALRARYRLLLLSNTNAIHYEMLEENYPILRHFDDRILSHVVGAMKPDPRIYSAAIATAGCAPERIFFTDDIAEYVEAACRHGIDAVQFESAEQLERELRARGLEW
jgi:putative hydrolase of the HAD superfamily